MGHIFVMMGKSATGKDTIYEKLIRNDVLGLRKVVEYTTRPVRSGEVDGDDYHFVDADDMDKYRDSGKLIEERCFESMMGPWYYFNMDDGSIDLQAHDYLLISTLPAYMSCRQYYGDDKVVPLYVVVNDKERIHRAIHREDCEKEPKYSEMCRRFLADNKDYSEANLKRAGITADKWFVNDYLDDCTRKIVDYIASHENA